MTNTEPGVYCSGWSLIWQDGDPPYEWAILASGGGYDDETASYVKPVPFATVVFAEPVTGYILGLYRQT